MRSNPRIRAGSPTSQGYVPTIARSLHRNSLARARADLFPMLDKGHKSETREFFQAAPAPRMSNLRALLALRRDRLAVGADHHELPRRAVADAPAAFDLGRVAVEQANAPGNSAGAARPRHRSSRTRS